MEKRPFSGCSSSSGGSWNDIDAEHCVLSAVKFADTTLMVTGRSCDDAYPVFDLPTDDPQLSRAGMFYTAAESCGL